MTVGLLANAPVHSCTVRCSNCRMVAVLETEDAAD